MALRLIVGPMYSGKTDTLILELKKQKIADMKLMTRTALVKFTGDNRYNPSNSVVSLSNLKEDDAICTRHLTMIYDLVKDAHNIFIDEGQFFTDLAEACTYWLDLGKNVTISALSSDHNMKNWPAVVELYPMASSIKHLTSVCNMCGGIAIFTKRKTSVPQVFGTVVDIGGTEKYDAVCRKCYFNS